MKIAHDDHEENNYILRLCDLFMGFYTVVILKSKNLLNKLRVLFVGFNNSSCTIQAYSHKI